MFKNYLNHTDNFCYICENVNIYDEWLNLTQCGRIWNELYYYCQAENRDKQWIWSPYLKVRSYIQLLHIVPHAYPLIVRNESVKRSFNEIENDELYGSNLNISGRPRVLMQGNLPIYISLFGIWHCSKVSK